ncbi:hypothetical protein [Legionella cincinnatiensis]|nr:hypothetical protein [Legionella cincinnatiensis]
MKKLATESRKYPQLEIWPDSTFQKIFDKALFFELGCAFLVKYIILIQFNLKVPFIALFAPIFTASLYDK